MEKISVFIITKNEAKRISTAINSIKKIADEIIIVDSNSTDNTVQICQNLGAQVVINSWPGYLKQKAFAESLCKNDWILNIDADEELSEALEDEIEYIFASNLQHHYTAYKIKITIIHRLDNKVRNNAPFTQAIRLYNKNYWGFIDDEDTSSTHDSVTYRDNSIIVDRSDSDGLETRSEEVKPMSNRRGTSDEVGKVRSINYRKIYELNEPAFHRSGTSIEQLITKANFFSSQQADDLIKNGAKISRSRIVFEIPWFFCKTFFIRRYYVFGFNGFVDSIILSFARFLRLVKAREIQQIHTKHKNSSM